MRKLTSKVIAIVLCIMIAIPMTTLFVSADATPAVWDGVTAENFAGGDGTAENPYQITSGGHLALMSETINLAEDVMDLGGLYFKVMNDIDMNGHAIEPIGGQLDDIYFSGYFDGNNKTISNLNVLKITTDEVTGATISSGAFQSVGLFGCTNNAVIRNVILKDLYNTDGITAETYFNAGALVGKAINSQIINCHVDSDLVFQCCKPSSQTTIYAGSLIGFLQDSTTVKGCTYDGTLQVNGRGDGEENSANRVATVVGGLIGRLDGDIVNAETVVRIEDCLVSGTLLGKGTTYHMWWGGLFGIAYNGWGATDDATGNPTVMYVKNVLVTVTIDVDDIDMSKTASANNYMYCGGITTSTNKYSLSLDNVHFIGDISSPIAAHENNIQTVKAAGIIASSPLANSTYTKVTTNFERVTRNDVEYNSSGNADSGVKWEQNWKGNWDKATCAVNTSAQKDIVFALITASIAAIESYDDAYNSDDFDINDPFGGDDITPPDGGNDDQTPDGGNDDQTPDGGNDNQTPDGGNDNQTPDGGKDGEKDDKKDDAKTEENKGCGSSITMAGIAMVAALGTAAVAIKKKEN